MIADQKNRERGNGQNGESDATISVLLVEDNPGDVGLMKASLEGSVASRYIIHSAERLHEAIDKIPIEEPDVILLDIGLPDSSGLSTVERMIAAAGSVPIIVLTGLSDEKLGMEAVWLGAQDYLTKGAVSPGELERAIRYSIQRRKVLRDLKESNQRYQSLFNDNHAVMVLIDPVSGAIVDVNQAAVDFFNYSREELTSLNAVDLFNMSSEKVFELLGKAASRDQQHLFLQNRLSDGTFRDVETFNGPINIRGKVIIYSIIHDVTERKRAEAEQERLTAELAKQHLLLQTVVGNSAFGIMVVAGPDLNIIISNDAFESFLGAGSEKAIGQRLSALPFAERNNGSRLLDMIGEVMRTGQPLVEKEMEHTGLSGRGKTFWHLAVRPLPGATGDHAVLVMAQDMTDQVAARHRIEELAERSQSERLRLKTILENLPVGVIVTDRNGKVHESTETVDVIWGGRSPRNSSIQELSKLNGWWADTGMVVRPEEWSLARAVKDGDTTVGAVIDIQRMDGTRGTIISSAAPIRDAEGRIIGGVEVVQDITRQRKLEHDAIEAKEQAELYIDLLSHDISNMNAAISSYLQLALEKMDIEEKNKPYFTNPLDILNTSNRLIDNVRKIQQVEGHESKHSMIDLGWLLEDVRAEAEKTPGRDVRISYKTAIKKFVIASELLVDVFENLVGNAIKHSSGRVEISITLTKMFESGREYYKVAIEDNGPGIPDDMKSKLFQRKQRGRTKTAGTGLGLFLVKKLVEDFSGRVWVEDRVPGEHSEGARFVVMLPAVSMDGTGPIA